MNEMDRQDSPDNMSREEEGEARSAIVNVCPDCGAETFSRMAGKRGTVTEQRYRSCSCGWDDFRSSTAQEIGAALEAGGIHRRRTRDEMDCRRAGEQAGSLFTPSHEGGADQ